MRTVAKFQFTAPSDGEHLAEQVKSALDAWTHQKFHRMDGSGYIIRRSARPAIVEVLTDRIESQRRDWLSVLEPVIGGSLQTDVGVVAAKGRTAFSCVVSVGSDGQIAPTDVTIRAPRFVQEILRLDIPWTMGPSGERIFCSGFSVDVDDVADLEALMIAPERRLPIVVVSEFSGRALGGDLHEQLSNGLSGLAHIVRLSSAASWELTRRCGKEWSCYNGAVRLFWPIRPYSTSYRSHPLWTLDQLLGETSGETQARDRVRDIVSARIIEASTFVADDPIFRDFDTAKVRQAADQVRATAEDDGDYRGLAHAYSTENDFLRAEVNSKIKELQIAYENITALTIALTSSSATVDDVRQSPPQTVVEAVSIARNNLSSTTVIANETDVHIANLNPLAGPPEKILRYLQVLGRMADLLALGGLGKTVPVWLRENGVECSVDSETARASRDGRRFRTRLVNGTAVECDFHAKPSDNVPPDMCVRIYFAVMRDTPFVRIGYIGRHSP